MTTRITGVFVIYDDNSKLCKIQYFNGSYNEVFSFNVDYIPQDKITWFCGILENYIGTMVSDSYKKGRADLSKEMRHLLGITKKEDKG